MINNQHLKQKDLKQTSALLVSFYCLSTLLLSTNAQAQGVVAGTDISNKAVVNYVVSGDAQKPIESTPTGNSISGLGNGLATTFKVDRKIDLLLTGNNDANVSPGDSQSEVTFTLKNEGNDTQEFLLSNDALVSGDHFDSSNCHTTITQTTDASGLVTPLSPPITDNKITLSPDFTASISVKCDIPLNVNGQPLVKGKNALLALKATAQKNSDGSVVTQTTNTNTPNTVDTVFADNAGSDDANRDASHSARRSFITVSSATPPTLAIKKSIISIIDAKGGNSPVSGAKVTYKLLITTAGTGIINNVVITDPTPAEMTYKENSIYLGSDHLTDLNGDDKANFNTASKIATINLGSLNAGVQHEIRLSYIIN